MSSERLKVLLYKTNYGAFRRRELLKVLEENVKNNIPYVYTFPVNRRYCAQLSQDPDLKKNY